MKEYLKKNGIRIGIIVLAVAILIGLGSATRDGEIGVVQNVTGIVEAPVKKVLSSDYFSECPSITVCYGFS